MDDDRIPKQAIFYEMRATSLGPGSPRTNWNDIIRHDLESIGVAWEDAKHFTVDRDRPTWRDRACGRCVRDTR